MLLLGYDFFTTLSILLPASFALSLLQVLGQREARPPISVNLFLFTLPGIGVGLWLTSISPAPSWTNLVVGMMLVVTAAVRIWAKSRQILTFWLKKVLPGYHFIMGLIHGTTNLGGALLAVYASGIYKNKTEIRYTVAFYYLSFSSIQILTLVVFFDQFFTLVKYLPMIIIPGVAHTFVGNKIFLHADNEKYMHALTVFIAIYGITMLSQI